MRKYIIHLATAAIALVGFVACDVETNEKEERPLNKWRAFGMCVYTK